MTKVAGSIVKSALKSLLTLVFLLLLMTTSKAQNFEVGAWMGGANYFGDLNSNASFAMIRPAGGVFLRNNFNTRWVLKSSISFGQLAFDDKKSSAFEFSFSELNKSGESESTPNSFKSFETSS